MNRNVVNHLRLVLLMVIASAGFNVLAQAEQPNDGTVNARFASMSHEIAAVCGTLLPNQIPGITEYMALCGGRAGFKIGKNTILEPQLLAGAGRAQRYILGSLSFRGDVQIDDIIASYYGGADVHYATNPVFNAGTNTTESTNVYFGAHVGGALWWDMTENLALRSDLQFFVNPGTALFFGISLALRFDPQGNDGANPTP